MYIKSKLNQIFVLSFCDRLDFLLIICVCLIQEINLKMVEIQADGLHFFD